MQLLAAIVVVVLVAAAISLVVGAVLTRRAVDRSVLQDVAQQADLLAERERVAPPARPSGIPGLSWCARTAGDRHAARPAVEVLAARSAARVRASGRSDGTTSVDGKDWFYAARPVAGRALVLLRPRVVGAAAWRPYLEGLLLAAAISVALAAAISFLLARRIARPVRRVADASRSLAAGVDPGAIPTEGAAELMSLAESFNDMAIQLEHARDAERAFLSRSVMS